ncbi:MAG TPA: hypothetical protein VMY59_01175 [Candidatus Thermoplasmatota archaeon]|nr:hypothetical protein [Candidatus Thermoplasmatota archaeon]
MNNCIGRKVLVISVILLFIGVAVAPSINQSIVKASNDDLVEVTTQACGIKGYRDTTVKLTREQYQNLEQYLVDFRARLNQTSTREEAVPIFKEAVVELDKYGLLPKGMSVEKAQKLVSQQNQNDYLTKLQKRYLKNRILLNSNENYFSFIAGATTNTLILGPIPLTCILTGLIGFILLASASTTVKGIIGALMFYSSLYIGLLFYFLPGILFSVIRIGATTLNFDPDVPSEYLPSEGWISSFGITGKKTWVGPFYGNMVGPGLIGVVGFTGLKIALLNDCFYLGSAIKIGLSQNQPSME